MVDGRRRSWRWFKVLLSGLLFISTRFVSFPRAPHWIASLVVGACLLGFLGAGLSAVFKHEHDDYLAERNRLR